MGRKTYIFMGCIAVIIACGLFVFIYHSNPPEVISFDHVGPSINASKVDAVYVAEGKIYISIDDDSKESRGIVTYLTTPVDASPNTPFTEDTITFDSKKYTLYGNLTVDNTGIFRLPARDLILGGYAALRYDDNDIFESANNYPASEASVLQIYNGSYDEKNFYIEIEYDHVQGGTLCQFPLNGAQPTCYPHNMPPLYTGYFFVKNRNVYFSDTDKVTSKNLTSNAEASIGQGFDQIGHNITPSAGLLDYYDGRVYIPAQLITTSSAYLALCSTPINADSSAKWTCVYDPKIMINNNQRITNFKIGQLTGSVILSINDYDASTTQIYHFALNKLNKKDTKGTE